MDGSTTARPAPEIGEARREMGHGAHRVAPDGAITRMIEEAQIQTSNGLCFSPAFDRRSRLDRQGAGRYRHGRQGRDLCLGHGAGWAPSNPAPVQRLHGGRVKCGPDGLRRDVYGNLWASSNAGRVVGYSGDLLKASDGRLLGRGAPARGLRQHLLWRAQAELRCSRSPASRPALCPPPPRARAFPDRCGGAGGVLAARQYWKHPRKDYMTIAMNQGGFDAGMMEGIWPVAPTPFFENGEVDYDGMRRVLDCMVDQIDRHLHSANFSNSSCFDDEREALSSASLEHVAGRVPVIVTISHFATPIAVGGAAGA